MLLTAELTATIFPLPASRTTAGEHLPADLAEVVAAWPR